MTTLKKLAAAGTVKKADLYRVRPRDLKVEPGFNLRDESPELTAHIESICTSIMAGITVPPIEVRVDEKGNIIIVDGHCRQRGYLLAIERGAEIEHINVVPFTGNDSDRVAKMLASAQGMPLTMLEAAFGYKRLVAFGWDVPRIAASVGKTDSQIYNLLSLANANSDVHLLVRAGQVTASTAIEAVRKYGESAGAELTKLWEKGSKDGKAGRVSKSAVVGRPLPRKIVTAAVTSMEAFSDSIFKRSGTQIEAIRSLAPEKRQGVTVAVDAEALLELLATVDNLKAAKPTDAPKAEATEAVAEGAAA